MALRSKSLRYLEPTGFLGFCILTAIMIGSIIDASPGYPLYFQPEIYLFRTDLCGKEFNSTNENILADLDTWEYGSSCK